MKSKKPLLALSVFTLLLVAFIACNKDEGENSNSGNVELKKMESFEDAEIGILEGKKMNIMVSKKQLLDYAEETLKDTKLNLRPYDYKIIEENNTKYLRIYSNNNYVSTVELLVSEGGVLKTAKTVCTSTSCASGGGCLPNGDYCSPCSPPNAPGLPGSGDCIRTSSGG